VKVLGLSLDTVQSHEQWSQDIRETQGTAINFPIVSDLDRRVATAYGMLHPLHDPYHTVRTVFVIDPRQRIRLTMTYPQTCGRNFDELLRVVDSLQLTDGYSVSTPANWHSGDIACTARSSPRNIRRSSRRCGSLPYRRYLAGGTPSQPATLRMAASSTRRWRRQRRNSPYRHRHVSVFILAHASENT
jgi:AhpC/TSA family